MGIIRAVTDAVSGALADQWLEVIEPDQMSDRTVFTAGVQMRQGERNSNTKRTSAVVSNGSVIHVYPNQFMLLVDGGKIVDYTAEEGYYTVNNSSEPSLFNGDLGDSVKESFNRVRFGGTTPYAQKVFYVNLQEIKGIKFGTTTSPLPFNLWIQIVPTGEAECKMKLTIGMELNPFMKAMVQKPLQEGLEKMADMLALIQY